MGTFAPWQYVRSTILSATDPLGLFCFWELRFHMLGGRVTRHIAILIDAGFFLKRLPKLVPADQCGTPEAIVSQVKRLCFRHVTKLTHCHRNDWQQHLYRVFYYDATPYEGKEHHPVLNRPLDFGKSDTANHRRAIFKSLLEQRKLALRLGKVNLDLLEHIDGLQSGLPGPGRKS